MCRASQCPQLAADQAVRDATPSKTATAWSVLSCSLAGAGGWVVALAQEGRLPAVLAAAAAVIGLQLAVPAAIRCSSIAFMTWQATLF